MELEVRVRADPADREDQIEKVNIEIDHLHRRIDDFQVQFDEKKAEIDDHEIQNDRAFADWRDIQAEIEELTIRTKQVVAELSKIEAAKQSHSEVLSKARRTYGVASVKEGVDRLDEIDERIEEETLRNSQLRQLLVEKDHIRSGMGHHRE